MSPVEHTALDMALTDAVAANSTPTLPMVLEYLLNPSPETVALVGRDGGTGVGHSLRRTVAGDLEGMFDAPSTVAFDADAPIMVMDTSALIGASEQALSLAAACGATWLEAAVTNPDGAKRIVVYDEGWRMLADPYMLAKMSEQWRLARTYGIANLLIMHKVADLNEIGDGSSGLRQKALGLLTEADTRIIYRQKHDAMRLTKEALGLTEAECEHVENLPKGMGLWKVGNRSFIVANRITTDEMAVFGTDGGMR